MRVGYHDSTRGKGNAYFKNHEMPSFKREEKKEQDDEWVGGRSKRARERVGWVDVFQKPQLIFPNSQPTTVFSF
jgi:hypothetical protein